MGRITNMQNEIGHLQNTLHERNLQIAALHAKVGARDADIEQLKQKLAAALAPVAAAA